MRKPSATGECTGRREGRWREPEPVVLNLSGRHVFITGGASGIGAATAELFAEKGATITVADIQEDLGRSLVRRLGPKHRFAQLDVSKPEEWLDVMAEVPALDVLMLNAGVSTRPRGAPAGDDPLLWMAPEHLKKVFDVNVAGVVHGITACLPKLRGRPNATIFATSSSAGLRPFREDPLYVATKYGVVGLVGSLGPLLAEQGIRIVCVCPTSILTPMVAPDTAVESADKFSPPSFMAQAFFQIYQRAQPGETWTGGGKKSAATSRNANGYPI
jgi:NAD(P)-dependent dehydrogenase (short-subunit alcohol dehydrogenase family)